jgi:hypothetical protein
LELGRDPGAAGLVARAVAVADAGPGAVARPLGEIGDAGLFARAVAVGAAEGFRRGWSRCAPGPSSPARAEVGARRGATLSREHGSPETAGSGVRGKAHPCRVDITFYQTLAIWGGRRVWGPLGCLEFQTRLTRTRPVPGPRWSRA